MTVTKLIDQFVMKVDPSKGIFRRIDNAPWIDALESLLPRKLPSSFRNLVTRYAFESFDIHALTLFGNSGLNRETDLTELIFRDRVMAQALLKNGYIQFARPETGSYDPICFDARKPVANREFGIVRLDHEEILRHDRIKVVEKVAESFFKFAADIACCA
jgi:SMI1 / KNR4 family (SUKH-1)